MLEGAAAISRPRGVPNAEAGGPAGCEWWSAVPSERAAASVSESEISGSMILKRRGTHCKLLATGVGIGLRDPNLLRSVGGGYQIQSCHRPTVAAQHA